MNVLTIAFTAEGTTDERFLSSIIERTAIDLLSTNGRGEVDVLPPQLFHRQKELTEGSARIYEIIQHTRDYHCLIIHADADNNSPERAINERINPGINLTGNNTEENQVIIPLVPVYMTEAWMLSDPQAIRAALNTHLDPYNDLQLPKPKNIESVANPKQLLEQCIRLAQKESSRRHRNQLRISDLYARLADIDLNKLHMLDSYKRFADDMLSGLRRLQLAD